MAVGALERGCGVSEMLTAKQVMARLKLGRTTVYGLGRRYLETGGAEGLPCRKIGRALRFPADEVDDWMTTKPITHPGDLSRSTPPPEPRPTVAPTTPAPAVSSDALDDDPVEPVQLTLLCS
jgi:predicted DNA-binding transcriptional regulator AlpA